MHELLLAAVEQLPLHVHPLVLSDLVLLQLHL